jgi:hypothetical protein
MAAIVVAASGIAEYRCIGPGFRLETMMGRTAAATGMRRRSESLQRDWNECSGQRKQQQKSCGQALH